jgi:peptide deformylase
MILELVDGVHPLIETKLDEFDFESNKVTYFDDEKILHALNAQELEEILLENMAHHEGLGLSSNQIGINCRAFAMLHEGEPLIMFNPKVIEATEETTLMKEGCLTWFGLFPKVTRPSGVSINWRDRDGEEYNGNFIGLSARIILHEYDHLNGYTFFDRAGQIHMQKKKKKMKTLLRKTKNGKI